MSSTPTKRKVASASPPAEAGAQPGNSQQQRPQQQGQRRQQQQQPEQSFAQTAMQFVSRALMAWMVINLLGGELFLKKDVPGAESAASTAQSTHLAIPKQLYPLWEPKTVADLFVYVSEDAEFSDFENKDSLVWHAPDIELADYKEDRVHELKIKPSEHVQNNGTLYAHIYYASHPVVLDPKSPDFHPDRRVYTRKELTRYHKKRWEPKVKKLIGGKDEESEEDATQAPGPVLNKTTIVSYWHQNLTINIMGDRAAIQYGQTPPQLQSLYQLESTGHVDENGNGYVLPVLYVNDFWLLREHMTLINSTVDELPLRINYYPLSFMKLHMYASMDMSFQQQSAFGGASTGSEMDEVKRMLIETNPWLLALTGIVSLLHSVFEMLAFKNDIAFWKDKKGTGGMSVRAMFLDVIQQVVVFAYLMDNTEETSYMILFGQGVGLLIEFWKIKKAMKLKIVPTTTGLLPYKIHIDDSEPMTELESKTKEYDEEAFKYLTWAAFPMLGCYAIYSLLYQEHKSWYSFVVSTLVGFVYTFGFIKMTPQLFINYKLKSVAHMPLRTMMYKSLNTFIDDLFSFIIKMPMMHRLACLRDDVVFIIYLYQRWIYRTDHSRANEYGQVGEADEKEVKSEQPEESKKDK
ncbi:hypothetical protein DFQ27_006139 [Actinomortierella ambigua]|uniref:Cleft lip and palate associated transmembrane protein n=1 Tax=Actinomortierella ambigua TaxID=1343610 RepID=A0A9P6UC67_9FUNG|nr:hypothetical protein DFQ27_006139 [Actinomortierella ambigua]